VRPEARTLETVWGGTFHSIANRLLRTYGEAIGLDSDFTVMDQSDAEDSHNAHAKPFKWTYRNAAHRITP
jgi:superfamily I DNA/RNA helicase